MLLYASSLAPNTLTLVDALGSSVKATMEAQCMRLEINAKPTDFIKNGRNEGATFVVAVMVKIDSGAELFDMKRIPTNIRTKEKWQDLIQSPNYIQYIRNICVTHGLLMWTDPTYQPNVHHFLKFYIKF